MLFAGWGNFFSKDSTKVAETANLTQAFGLQGEGVLANLMDAHLLFRALLYLQHFFLHSQTISRADSLSILTT